MSKLNITEEDIAKVLVENAPLLKDALEVNIKCNLKPSELLEQRNELLEEIRQCFSYFDYDTTCIDDFDLYHKLHNVFSKFKDDES